jgi:uncharacterized membrane protein YuzA (DUF378 family)
VELFDFFMKGASSLIVSTNPEHRGIFYALHLWNRLCWVDNKKDLEMIGIKLVSYILVIVGALNWGLWGVAQFDIVATIFGGNTTTMARIVYGLVGISAVVSVGLSLGGNKNTSGSLVSA